MQAYLNIYDSREKFIQMLPDLQFIQEEIIANSIGEDLLKVVIDFARDGKLPESTDAVANSPLSTLHSTLDEPTLQRLVHRLRKVMVALLVGRTAVLKYAKEQKVQAHDDGVRMLQNVVEYLRSLIPEEPAPAPATDKTAKECGCPCQGSQAGAAMWTPPLL